MATRLLKKHPIEMINDITNADEHYEATGFVLDCIVADGSCDDPLGDSAALKPKSIVRSEDGSILAVICTVRPRDLPGIECEEKQVLVSMT